MFTRLERNVYAVLVMLALCAALVLASSAPAQAQAASTAEDTPDAHANTRGNLSHVVVRPGDSLWTISEERLGPNATPQRIVNGAEQIYTLNREQIGADPGLIFVGQELLVPPAMSERPTGTTPANRIAEAVPRDRVAEGTTVKAPKPAPRTVAGGADAEGVEDSETLVQRSDEPVSLPALPDEASAAPANVVTVVASNDARPTSFAPFLVIIRTEFASAASGLVEAFFGGSGDTPVEGRRLLGLEVMVLTLVVAALMAWKLPMRRTIRQDSERWGMLEGYYGYYGETPTASRIIPFVQHPGPLRVGSSLGDRDEQDTQQEAPGALVHRRRAVLTGSGDVSSAARVRMRDTVAARGRPPKANGMPRNGLALGAHNPKVRRAPLRANASMRARKLRPRLRPRRGTLGQALPPGTFGQTRR